MPLASRPRFFMCRISTLGPHIPKITQRISKEQMARVTTRRIVAVMKHKKSIRNWAVHNDPCYSMSPKGPSKPRGLTITESASGFLPFPALVHTAHIQASPEGIWRDAASMIRFDVHPAHEFINRGSHDENESSKQAFRRQGNSFLQAKVFLL